MPTTVKISDELTNTINECCSSAKTPRASATLLAIRLRKRPKLVAALTSRFFDKICFMVCSEALAEMREAQQNSETGPAKAGASAGGQCPGDTQNSHAPAAPFPAGGGEKGPIDHRLRDTPQKGVDRLVPIPARPNQGGSTAPSAATMAAVSKAYAPVSIYDQRILELRGKAKVPSYEEKQKQLRADYGHKDE